MRSFQVFFCVLFLLGVGGLAQAQVTKLKGNSFENGVVPNTITNDLTISFDGQYTGNQLRIELTAGSIYQHPSGSHSPPNEIILTIVPNLVFDSFLAQGSLTAGSPDVDPAPSGGSVNIGGSPPAVFTSEGINQASNPHGGVVIVDREDFITHRITLSSDAQGTWSYLASAEGIHGVVENMPINNGYMQ